MTMLEMSEAEKNELIQCWNPKCNWVGRKIEMTSIYISPRKKSFIFAETVEGYQYKCPRCGNVLMTSTM